MGWLSTWKHRIKITVDNTKVDTNLTNFPLHLKIVNSNVFSEVGANGKKIAVTTSDGITQCYVEIEHWDDFMLTGWLWSKIPSISSSSDTDIYIYYDNSKPDNTSYVGDIGDTPSKNVWSNDYIGVWHMNQDPSGGANCMSESTSENNDGTTINMVSGDSVPSIDKALQFGTTAKYMTVFDSEQVSTAFQSLGNNDSFTVSMLMVGSDSGTTGENYWRPNTGLIELRQQTATDTHVPFSIGITNNHIDMGRSSNYVTTWEREEGTVNIGNSAWHTVAVSVNNDTVKFIIDGTLDVTRTFTTATGDCSVGTTISNLFISTLTNNDGTIDSAYSFIGNIDEIRISKTNRSEAWEKAQHNSLLNTLLTYGSEESSSIKSINSILFNNIKNINSINAIKNINGVSI